MKKKNIFWIAVLVILAVIAQFYFFQNKPEKEEIKVGAILSMTGEGGLAEYGKRCKDGIIFALKEINKRGGVQGNYIKVLFEDSKGQSKEGVSSANKLININRTKFIIGAIASSVTLSIEPLTTKNKIILISPASSSPKLSGISKYFFRLWPSDDFEATALADYTFKVLNLKNVAILYVNNDYGLGLKNEFQNHFAKLGGKIPVVDNYPQGETNFRPQLIKIISTKAQTIYLTGYHKEMAQATKQLRELGFKGQILGNGDYGVQELISIAGKAAEGAIFAIPEYAGDRGNKTQKSFYESFYLEYKEYPTIFEANAYDCLMILANAIEKVGLNSDDISSYISKLKHYDGVSGDVSFNEKGDVIKPISIKKIINQKFELIETLNLAGEI